MNKKYEVVKTRQFKKDFKKYKHNKSVILTFSLIAELLSKGEKLPEKYKDHQLSGNMKKYRECHIFPDVLLVYKKDNDELILSCIRIGSHSEIF
jgi:mRNA interferase YafQ